MKKRTNNIWIVLDSRGFGGIESHVEQLALGLKAANNQVSIVFLQNYGEHPLQRRLMFSGLDCIMLDGRIASLWQALKKKNPM